MLPECTRVFNAHTLTREPLGVHACRQSKMLVRRRAYRTYSIRPVFACVCVGANGANVRSHSEQGNREHAATAATTRVSILISHTCSVSVRECCLIYVRACDGPRRRRRRRSQSERAHAGKPTNPQQTSDTHARTRAHTPDRMQIRALQCADSAITSQSAEFNNGSGTRLCC